MNTNKLYQSQFFEMAKSAGMKLSICPDVDRKISDRFNITAFDGFNVYTLMTQKGDFRSLRAFSAIELCKRHGFYEVIFNGLSEVIDDQEVEV